MSRTLEAIKRLPFVEAVDDERGIGNSIIVTLQQPWCFKADRGCGVRGFDNVAEVRAGVRASTVYQATRTATA